MWRAGPYAAARSLDCTTQQAGGEVQSAAPLHAIKCVHTCTANTNRAIDFAINMKVAWVKI